MRDCKKKKKVKETAADLVNKEDKLNNSALITINKSENEDVTLLAQQEIITESTISESDFDKEENNNNKEEHKSADDVKE